MEIKFNPASEPPKTSEGKWSKDVIVITDHGRAYTIAYFGEKEGGCWQRPSHMAYSEIVEWWSPIKE